MPQGPPAEILNRSFPQPLWKRNPVEQISTPVAKSLRKRFADRPAHWTTYIASHDADATIARAKQLGQLLAAETAARAIDSLSLSDALSLCLLLERENDPRCDQTFKRWLRHMQLECNLRREQMELLRAAAGALRFSPWTARVLLRERRRH
jgi:hypothetical protein